MERPTKIYQGPFFQFQLMCLKMHEESIIVTLVMIRGNMTPCLYSNYLPVGLNNCQFYRINIFHINHRIVNLVSNREEMCIWHLQLLPLSANNQQCLVFTLTAMGDCVYLILKQSTYEPYIKSYITMLIYFTTKTCTVYVRKCT